MKKKTSIAVNAELWKRWINFVVNIHGSTRKVSEEIEKALLGYMVKESNRISADELRRYFDIKEIKYDLEVPEELEKKILEMRHNRTFM